MASSISSTLNKVLVKLNRLDLSGQIEVDLDYTKCGASFDVFRGSLRVDGKHVAVRQLRVHLRSQRKYSKVRTSLTNYHARDCLTFSNRESLVNFSFGSNSSTQTSFLSLDTHYLLTMANFLHLLPSGWRMEHCASIS